MTRKEAINMLKSKMDGHTDTSYEWVKTVRMAIKALEQEPSGDLISRQAVMDCFKKWQPYMATRLRDFEQELSNLPSVKQERTGHWIYDEERSDWLDTTYHCSCCKRTIVIPYESQKDLHNDYPYCHCGAKMVEQERSK